jgi:HSP20 family protein
MAEKRVEHATAPREENRSRQESSSQQGEQNRPGGQQQGIAQTGRESRLGRGIPSIFMNPFALLGRLAEEMTDVFAEAGTERGLRSQSAAALWSPDIDVFQRGNELVVRADLPGVNPDDVTVEVSDDAITLSGERQEEHREERGGVYRFERSYGSFFRTIPLPEGAITDQAKASFKDGVLEVRLPAPPEQVSRGRRLEISRGAGSAETRESSKERPSSST